jgi:hypothetical protein
MISNHVKQRMRAGKPPFGATTDTANRRIKEGWSLVGMVNDQRLLAGAAQVIRDAVPTDR